LHKISNENALLFDYTAKLSKMPVKNINKRRFQQFFNASVCTAMQQPLNPLAINHIQS